MLLLGREQLAFFVKPPVSNWHLCSAADETMYKLNRHARGAFIPVISSMRYLISMDLSRWLGGLEQGVGEVLTEVHQGC